MKAAAHLILFSGILATGFQSCTENKTSSGKAFQDSVQTYLDNYGKNYQKLYTHAVEGEWQSNIKIVDNDSSATLNARKSQEELAKFTGSVTNIETIRNYLSRKNELTPLQIKQLENVLLRASNNPQTIPDLVSKRIKAEAEANKQLFQFDFKINGQSVSPNDIDEGLRSEKNMSKRLAIWNASKEVGKGLKQPLVELRDLRNKTVQALGFKDFFNYQVADYGMTTEEMMALLKKINQELFPLFRELHTYARYELAKSYGEKTVPDYLPAHWMPNRWGQAWTEMINVEGFDLNNELQKKDAEWIVKQAERFYVSLGMPALPPSFYEKSSLYPVAKNAGYKKNTHASAWHINLEKDVRSLMSVVPNEEWYQTTHHELGHIYYYLAYSRPEIPFVLREGANRAYHEALGSLMGMAAMQKPFLSHLQLLPADTKTDDMKILLKEAMDYIVVIPWGAGIMSEFEHDLYVKQLPADQFNKRWWDLTKKYMGIVPPTERGEEYCDAATKTHIINDAAQYYDYALSFVILFQLHNHIAKNILHQDPHATNYYGNKEVGKFIWDIMQLGASRDWREIIKEKTGEELSAKAMLDYFSPLMDYLKKANEGRKYTMEMPQ